MADVAAQSSVGIEWCWHGVALALSHAQVPVRPRLILAVLVQEVTTSLRKIPCMCVDMCIDMCPDMCIDMCPDMCIDMCIDLCPDMCVDRCIDMCPDMCVDTPSAEYHACA